MKKLICTIIAIMLMSAMLQGCGSKAGRADNSPSSETSGAEVPQTGITAEMAYEGVNNYCHSHYDWSVAEENPDVMYVRMGERGIRHGVSGDLPQLHRLVRVFYGR